MSAITRSTTNYVNKRPTMFQLQEAIVKNICGPTKDEAEDFTISRFVRASYKMEGDSQLGIMLFIGLATKYGYTYSDVSHMATVEREEFNYKLSKFKRKSKSNDTRFLNKLKLVTSYLRLIYGV